jgi:carboxypeptidase Taq
MENNMEAKLNELRSLLREAADLRAVSAVLDWDQTTYMPAGGAPARARQSSLMARLAQEKSTNPRIGRLLDDLRPYAESLPFDHPDAALVRVARRNFERHIKVPPAFIGEMVQLGAETFAVWVKARQENDFPSVRPYLEKILDKSRRLADFFPGYEHIADPLIDIGDYGMKATTLRQLFAQLRRELVPIVQRIIALPPIDDNCLRRTFDQAGQLVYTDALIRRLGYDFNRGRQDLTHHPFTTRFSTGDVRITTRVQENYLADCLFSSIHEAGHAMYEQGIRPEYDASPLGMGASHGVHESQSRLWENQVGRSWEFWEFAYPILQQTFPGQLDDVRVEEFYRAVNKVQSSLIRTDADEVTYNLHVMIRFDLELALLEGNLLVRDLPEAWHAHYQADLGVHALDDRAGVLQDVHWYAGQIGGVFQGYTLGNILGAQFYNSALQAHPEIPTEMLQGKFNTLHTWLVEQIYQYGSIYSADELVKRVTGGPLSIQPYIQYLQNKYGKLYSLPTM